MKKIAFSSISFAMLTICQHASAQSAVTLYGILDSGIGYVHNSGGKSTQVMSTTGMTGPRWGLKGTEDLGNGLNALFGLENGFSISSGQFGKTGTEFNRSAFVGLGSTRYGTVTMGRQYEPLTDQVQPITADWVYGGLFAPPGDIDNYDDSAWFNNSVKWSSPVYRGLQVETMYSFGGVAGSASSGQTWSAAASYKTGPMAFATGFTHIDYGNPTLSTRGTSSADSLFNSPVNAGYASAKSVGIFRVASEYKTSLITAGAAYSLTKYNRDAYSSFANNETFHNASVFADYNFTPAWRAGAGYNYTRALGDTSAKYHSIDLGTAYAFSKRTSVYVIAGYVHALGSQRNTAGSVSAAQAVVGSFDIASGAATQELVVAGLRHSF